jgi:hypothetical protein
VPGGTPVKRLAIYGEVGLGGAGCCAERDSGKRNIEKPSFASALQQPNVTECAFRFAPKPAFRRAAQQIRFADWPPLPSTSVALG